MACTNFPNTGLVANVTTHTVGEILYKWTGSVWEAVSPPVDFINNLSLPYVFDTVADMTSSVITFPVGKKIHWLGYYAKSDGGSNWGTVKSGAHTADGGSVFTLADGKYIAANLKGNKLNVAKFGVIGDVDRSTQMQNAVNYPATADNQELYMPSGSYKFANIDIPSPFVLHGAGGESGKTLIKVNQNNGSCFRIPDGGGVTTIQKVLVTGLAVTADIGITGAKFWDQINREKYTAYAEFFDIETYADLAVAFDGYFIFTEWKKCRHGFSGTPNASTQFIKSTRGSVEQSIETNLCQVKSCRIFNTVGGAAIELERGFDWRIIDTDFEGLDSLAVSAKGVIGLHFEGCWFEEVNHSSMIFAGIYTAASPQGSWNNTIKHSHINMSATTGTTISTDGNAVFAIDENTCIALGTTKNVISSGWESRVLSFDKNRLESSAGFIYGNDVRTQLNGVVTANSRNTPFTQQLLLNNKKATNLASVDFTQSGLVSFTDTTSEIGLSSALQLRMGSGHNLIYRQIPDKLFQLIKGQLVTVTLMGYSAAVNATQSVKAAVWNASPAGSGVATTTLSTLNMNDTNLGTCSTQYQTSTSDAGLWYGFYTGGGTANAFFTIEALQISMGDSEPFIISMS